MRGHVQRVSGDQRVQRAQHHQAAQAGDRGPQSSDQRNARRQNQHQSRKVMNAMKQVNKNRNIMQCTWEYIVSQ